MALRAAIRLALVFALPVLVSTGVWLATDYECSFTAPPVKISSDPNELLRAHKALLIFQDWPQWNPLWRSGESLYDPQHRILVDVEVFLHKSLPLIPMRFQVLDASLGVYCWRLLLPGFLDERLIQTRRCTYITDVAPDGGSETGLWMRTSDPHRGPLAPMVCSAMKSTFETAYTKLAERLAVYIEKQRREDAAVKIVPLPETY